MTVVNSLNNKYESLVGWVPLFFGGKNKKQLFFFEGGGVRREAPSFWGFSSFFLNVFSEAPKILWVFFEVLKFFWGFRREAPNKKYVFFEVLSSFFWKFWRFGVFFLSFFWDFLVREILMFFEVLPKPLKNNGECRTETSINNKELFDTNTASCGASINEESCVASTSTHQVCEK